VLFTSLQPFIVPVIAAWTQSGNEISALVATDDSRRFLDTAEEFALVAPQWSWRKALARHAPAARIVFLRRETPWDDWAAVAGGIDADLLISAHFMQRVPAAVLAGFPLGGVNLHPAMLPEGAGVRPLHRMVAEGRHRELAGMTLHEMTERFDAGPIISRARLAPSAFASEAAFQAAVGGAMAALVRERLPQWCCGDLKAVPQDMERRGWAGELKGPMVVGGDWPFERLDLATRLLRQWPGFVLDHGGERIALHPRIHRLGPPTGAPPVRTDGRVEFDLADARVVSVRQSPLARLAARFGRTVSRLRSQPVSPAAIE
jgi:methionyl-tRNA formyltransferase